MSRRRVRCVLPLSLLLSLAPFACRGVPAPGAPGIATRADTAGAVPAAEAWWRAFTVADTAALATATAPRLSLTLGNGVSYDRAAALAQAATHTRGGSLTSEWSDVTVMHPAPGRVAVVTSRVREGNQGGANRYRFLTVLERDGAAWRVSTAQSTRELVLTPTVSAEVSGPLAEYAGSYRGPRGGGVRIAVRDTALALVDMTGAELLLVPVGPALFESSVLSPGNGVLRFVFTRDATGRVTSLSRLLNGAVNTWARMP